MAVKSAYLSMIRKDVVAAHYIQSLGLCVFGTLGLAPSKQFRHSPSATERPLANGKGSDTRNGRNLPWLAQTADLGSLRFLSADGGPYSPDGVQQAARVSITCRPA